MASLDREIGKAWDVLAEADDNTRPARLIDLADLFHEATCDGDNPDADAAVADVLDMLADVELLVSGSLSRRHCTDRPLEAAIGPVLDRMATVPNVAGRAQFLEEIADALAEAFGDDTAAETIACMPYAPGMVGWRIEERYPTSRTLRAGIKAAGVAWRARRAI